MKTKTSSHKSDMILRDAFFKITGKTMKKTSINAATQGKAILALEDGKIFTGNSIGADGESFGEAVFNTSITGYQEIITDPSYYGQIITMTHTHIGNYGISPEDMECAKVWAAGFVVREASTITSNWRSKQSLQEFLKFHNVVAVEGIDTRALTRHIREAGAMKAVLSTQDFNGSSLVQKAKKSKGLVGMDLVKYVTCRQKYVHENRKKGKYRYRVALIDCGTKANILNELAVRGCEIHVFPASAASTDILNIKPDGVMLSNGPGDPAAVKYVIETVRKLLQHLRSNPGPAIFGICLGHQMLGLALGGDTYKLKFGHRGANHPVKNVETGKIEITSQNHGFCVNPDSLKGKDVKLTHYNLYDGTLEGFKHRTLPAFCVQYHPEAAPGPHESKYLFDRFIELMERKK
ncbi:MAG: glutamine-hydrolyzing carbamoyl-phosphate synthase small subunit [Endomicrobiales bacterium]|nr:glutamine-hydrolyzing carbamoyl-phosphate synthase small subunit [Endomicrobiales bacterium]